VTVGPFGVECNDESCLYGDPSGAASFAAARSGGGERSWIEGQQRRIVEANVALAAFSASLEQ